MSERPVSFFPVPVACNDAFDPAERAVRAVNGLTLRAAFEALSDAEIVLCAGRAPSDGAAGTERVWRALNGLATGEALEALRRAREIVLDGHRIVAQKPVGLGHRVQEDQAMIEPVAAALFLLMSALM